MFIDPYERTNIVREKSLDGKSVGEDTEE